MNIRTAKAATNIKDIEGQIRGLARQLTTLAHHPQASAHHGPLFISLNNAFNPAAEYDGALGSVMLDGFLGCAFADAANDNAISSAAFAVDYNMLEMGAQYAEERSRDHADDKTHNNFGHGRGSIALYERPCSKDIFNHSALDAYTQDLKTRKGIESHIASLLRELDYTKADYAFELAA